MKSVLAWMKANLPIVILSAVILLVLPAAFVGSSLWNSSIKKKREAEANKSLSNLKSLAISYQHPPATPSGQPVTYAADAPNARATEYFREHRKRLEEQVTKVAETAREINRDGHGLLVDGLFVMPAQPAEGQPPAEGEAAPEAPAAPTSADPLKALELAEMIVGRGDRPSVYQQLLDRINAGKPADPVRIAERLTEAETQFKDAILAQSNRTTLTEDEQADLTKRLVDLRIGEYRRRAREISVYASIDNLPRSIPRDFPAETPDAYTCFEWHFDYWVISDLLRAIDAANSPGGQRRSVSEAVVKRIVSMWIDRAGSATPPSITGRRSSPENKVYDVRNARLTLVVASGRLQDLINAISRTNFMTVTGLSFREVNPWDDLKEGYYYGDEHVVEATLDVETIWLRSWTEPMMPQAFRDVLSGVAEATGSDTPYAAPAPAMPRGRGLAPDEGARPGRRPRGGDEPG